MLPKDLPEFIEVDLSRLDVGDIVHLSDVKLPQGVECRNCVWARNTTLPS